MSHSAVNGHITETNIKEFCDHDPSVQRYAERIRASGIAVTPAVVGPGAADWVRERVEICRRLKRETLEELRQLLEARPMSDELLFERLKALSPTKFDAIDSDGLLMLLLRYAIFG